MALKPTRTQYKKIRFGIMSARRVAADFEFVYGSEVHTLRSYAVFPDDLSTTAAIKYLTKHYPFIKVYRTVSEGYVEFYYHGTDFNTSLL